MIKMVLGVFVVAAAATAGDYVWYTYGVSHSLSAGLVHGALLLTVVGAVLGAAAGHTLKGLPIGALAGIGGAASYYALIAVTGGRTYGTAIPAAWVILWLLLAAFDGRWLRAPARRSWPSIATRGAVAAVIGGLAFLLVMNVIWGRPPVGGRNYLVQWLAWVFAWAPGLLALTIGDSPVRTSDESAISNAQLLARIDRGEPLVVLDVRSEREFEAGHVPGAVNVPFNQVPSRMGEIPGAPGDEVVVYCGPGPRAYIAAGALRRTAGRRVVFMTGHWAGWQAAGLREER